MSWMQRLKRVFAVGVEQPMKTGQMNSWFRVQCKQSGDEIQCFENDMGGAIAVGCFELIAMRRFRPSAVHHSMRLVQQDRLIQEN